MKTSPSSSGGRLSTVSWSDLSCLMLPRGVTGCVSLLLAMWCHYDDVWGPMYSCLCVTDCWRYVGVVVIGLPTSRCFHNDTTPPGPMTADHSTRPRPPSSVGLLKVGQIASPTSSWWWRSLHQNVEELQVATDAHLVFNFHFFLLSYLFLLLTVVSIVLFRIEE